jgi:hypothetical protein
MTNIAKFILSVGPQTTKEKGVYQINLKDNTVQNMLIAYNGVQRYRNMITPFSPPPPPTAEDVAEGRGRVGPAHRRRDEGGGEQKTTRRLCEERSSGKHCGVRPPRFRIRQRLRRRRGPSPRDV